ncbi:MAG: hypothetical protein Q4A37_01745 [Candidatus Saccharibacteria bacterium]|nr:hypothetical protein [Candidatus Saccharibacteria bacterium]
MDWLLIALVVAALLIGASLMIAIQITSRRHGGLDRELYQKVWRAIQHGAAGGQTDSVQMAIMKADKLVDKAMRDSGVKGATMGERLKARRGQWSNEQALWAAHKLRNQIAHEPQVNITAQTFKRAMAGFESGLKDLGAL